MFSIFKKKKIVPHVRLTGVIGSAGRFNKGIDLAGQREILPMELISNLKSDFTSKANKGHKGH